MIRRIGLSLLTALVVAACEKGDDGPVERLSLSQEVALLPADGRSVATVDVEAAGPWSATPTGEGYEIKPIQGVAGKTTVEIAATGENNTKNRLELGSVRFAITDGGPDERTLEVVQRPVVASQTMLLYMPGRDLLSYYQSNIEGIRNAVDAGIPGDGRILVCYQPEADRATLLEIGYDAAGQCSQTVTLATYDPFRADDPQAVSKLLADLAETAPAQRYGVVIGCHGKGWVPSGSSIQALSRPGESPDDLWTPMPGALQTRAFGDTRRELDIAQLAEAMEAQSYRVEWLIFDACFMANIETLYDLRNSVDRIVAAPCEIMGAGFPYSRIVPRLFADQGRTCDLRGTCYEFWNFYENDWNSVPRNAQSGCISMTETEHLNDLADIMRRINELEPKSYNPNDLQIYEGMSSHLFYDLGHYVETICPDAGLLTEFEAQLEKAFPATYRFHTNGFYSAYNAKMNPIDHYSGVSVSEPSKRQVEANRQTAWYRETHR